MTAMTDPAREIADLCASLSVNTSQVGAEYLAEKFQVAGWSTEFYKIIFTISDRIDSLKDLTNQMEMDTDIRDVNVACLEQLRMAFTPNGLNNAWSHAHSHYVSAANINAVRSLSPFVRMHVSYPRLAESEVVDVLSDVKALADWLAEHQLSENDFIRQALIEGLAQVQFRLERLQWLGWGYAIHSMKEVIAAYVVLERGFSGVDNPQAEAVIRKTGTLIRDFFRKVRLAKDTWETTEFALKAYGACSLVAQSPKIIALLPHL